MPLSSVVIGGDYRYDVRFADADSDPLDFSLLEAPVGMSIHPSLGTVRWTPAIDQRGEIEITLRVTDPDGQSADQTFKLNVSRFGGPPAIRSNPPTEASVGTGYLYPIAATDLDLDPLTYSLVTAPAGADIDGFGKISWPTAGLSLGSYDFVVKNRVYDSLNRNIETTQTLDGVVTESFQTVYDVTGRVVSTLDFDGRTVDYIYDAGHRLIREEIVGGDGTARVLEYALDSVGNRLWRSDSQEGYVNYEYDTNDRLLKETSNSGVVVYEYDANGNLIAETKSPIDRREYLWDARNRLVGLMVMENGETTEIAYRYDLNGMRVSQSRNGVETKFTVDSTAEYDTTIAESDADGLVRAHVFGNGIVATVQEDGVFHYHADASGTKRGQGEWQPFARVCEIASGVGSTPVEADSP